MTEPAAGDLQGELLVVKSQTIESLGQLASLATTVGLDTLAEDLTKLRIPKLEEERFILVVLGEFNHGKSTFVNALCGQAILPAGITPTTEGCGPWNDGWMFISRGIPAICGFGPAGAGVHAADEYVELDSFIATTRIFVRAIIDYLGVAE